jgi:hypothetical protein
MSKAKFWWVGTVLALMLAGCSPEATRQRGEAGGDIRNVDSTVEMHGPKDIYFNTGIAPAIQVENRR